MRSFLTRLFFAAFSLLTPITSNTLSAMPISEEANQLFQYIQFEWQGDDEQLVFVMDVVEGLVFPEKFSLKKNKSSMNCRIELLVDPDYQFFSEEGHELQKIVLDVLVSNDVAGDEIEYKVEEKRFYLRIDNEDDPLLMVRTLTYYDTFENPEINLSKNPEFIKYSDVGVLVFENVAF